MATFKLDIGDAVDVADLLAKPSGGGRKLNERDVALDELVAAANQPLNAAKAIPWNIGTEKMATARQAAMRAVKRSGSSVFVSAKGNQIWFSQMKLSNRGRKAK